MTNLIALFTLVLIGTVASSPIQKGLRLIKRNEADAGVWMCEADIINLKLNGTTFVDITYDKNFSLENIRLLTHSIPTNLTQQIQVTNLIKRASRTRVENFVRNFTSFFNRYYQSESGEQSEKWLLSQVQTTLLSYNGNSSVREITHEWRQNSIVARIEGVDPLLKSEVVILGGHEDSIAQGGANGSAPGADDNASGSAVVLETLRILVEAGIRPRRTIDFHWYAAEEIGLLGSADVAKEYRERNVSVVAMLNLDVVGYQPPNQTEIAIFTDNGSYEVVQFLKLLADEYVSFQRKDKSCGYACSDHASWTRNGYPSAFAGEPEGNPDVHSPRDTFETVGFQQVMEFVKLAIGFAVELAT